MTRQRTSSTLGAAVVALALLLTALAHSHDHCFVTGTGAAAQLACVYCSGGVAPVLVEVALAAPAAARERAEQRAPLAPAPRPVETCRARGPPAARVIVI